MNVMVITQYYLPQPLANAEVIGGLVEALAQNGWTITVVSPVRDARSAPGVVHRRAFGLFTRNRASIPMRILEYGTFSLGALAAGWRAPRPDVVIAPSPPLTLGVIGLLISARHQAPFVYNVQDLYPEVASAVGAMPIATRRLMQGLARFVYRWSALVVVIDPAFESIIRRSSPRASIASVRNGIDMSPFESACRDHEYLSSIGVPNGQPVVMYAGNVGRSQDLHTVIEATRDSGAALVVHGGGAHLKALEDWATAVGADHVHFSGYVDRHRLGSLFASADLHVVPLKPGVAGASIPSKLLSIFSAGRPAVVAAEAGSPTADILESAGAGWRVDPDDLNALRHAIGTALDRDDELERRGRSARAWAERFASRERMAEDWSALLSRLGDDHGFPTPAKGPDGRASTQMNAHSLGTGMRNLGRLVFSHPLASRHRVRSVTRILRWQAVSRVWTGELVVPFVNSTRLVVSRGMHGATGNYYAGLLEFEPMAFALHLLRSGDTFVDVGANVGVYSVLASAAIGAHTIAIEPTASAADMLRRNIALNLAQDRVDIKQLAASDATGTVALSGDESPTTHVVTAISGGEPRVVANTVDNVLAGRAPQLMKVDVEGWEHAVLRGSRSTLDSPDLVALIVETNDLTERHGVSAGEIAGLLEAHGFAKCSYDPFTRTLSPRPKSSTDPNTIFVRDRRIVDSRLVAARPFVVFGESL